MDVQDIRKDIFILKEEGGRRKEEGGLKKCGKKHLADTKVENKSQINKLKKLAKTVVNETKTYTKISSKIALQYP